MLVPVIGHLVIAAVNQEIEIEIIDGKGAMSIGGLTRIGVRDYDVAYLKVMLEQRTIWNSSGVEFHSEG